MANYARGADRERKVMVLRRSQGWQVIRAAGSHGEADLWAAKRGHRLQLIQVKADQAGPFAHFGPDARRRLLDEAAAADADALLAWWPPRRPPQFIPVSDWPT